MMPFDEPLGSGPGLKQWSERAAALLECDDDTEALAEASDRPAKDYTKY